MRDVEDVVPYGRRFMRTCDARPYGLYIRGDAVGVKTQSITLNEIDKKTESRGFPFLLFT